MRLAQLVEGHDVGVIQLAQDLCLAEESPDFHLRRFDGRLDRLERHEPAVSRADGLVDDPHAAAAQLTDNLVARDGLGMVANASQAGRADRDRLAGRALFPGTTRPELGSGKTLSTHSATGWGAFQRP